MNTSAIADRSRDRAVAAVRKAAHPLRGAVDDYDPLLELIGDARFVLIGEASHGTHEFYRERSQITKRLIREQDFNAVAVEADWPDAYRINRYVRGRGSDAEAVDALAGFQRFPTWMWRNSDVLDFVGWLRAHNDTVSSKVGFYGLDLYSLHASMAAVIAYLDRIDPEAAERARRRYACFDLYGDDPQAYGLAALQMDQTCENVVINQLIDLRRHAAEYAMRDGRIAEDDYFYTEQNARLVRDAEQYYRTMYLGEVSSWNLRDRHMAETLNALAQSWDGELPDYPRRSPARTEPRPPGITQGRLDALVEFFQRSGARAKVVVWAHNSHLGDARATQMGVRGEWNVGQLVRKRYGLDVVLVGCTTYDGTVTAASNWDAPPERKSVRPALAGSYEALFHGAGLDRFLLNLHGGLVPGLDQPRLERAIGVIYRPDTERASHYFHASLPAQFDAVLHFDRTRAVEPLERTAVWEKGELPETFPSGI